MYIIKTYLQVKLQKLQKEKSAGRQKGADADKCVDASCHHVPLAVDVPRAIPEAV